MNLTDKETLLKNQKPCDIIEALEPYITEPRKQRIELVLARRLHNLQLAIESPCDINNALAAIRTCEALGISQVHIISPDSSASCAQSITQGAMYWVDIHFYETLDVFLNYIKENNFTLAGGSLTAKQTLSNVSIKNPLCIMVGNERRGLSKEALNACDILYKIPMVGMSESMNLSVSAAISLYDTSQRKREILQQESDLTPMQALALKAKYYLQSVSTRLAKGLLKG